MTDWEARYQQADTPWDKGVAAPPLGEFLERYSAQELWGEGPVLVPGCGFGHDVREISRHGVEVVGLDLSPSALEGAQAAEPVGRERYVCGDLFADDWHPEGGFSGWWEHTCFCAIDPADRTRYAEVAGNLLRPGGHLVGVFFLTPNDPGEEGQGPPFEASREEIIERLSPWFEWVDGWVPGRSYPGREGREWTAVFRRRS